jgi:ATP-dependent RNA helicase DHX8/PRP22
MFIEMFNTRMSRISLEGDYTATAYSHSFPLSSFYMADTDLYDLEFLSLVNKITQEINNHIGIHDKSLAEFTIALHDDSKTLAEFKQKLQGVGADFPESVVDNIDRLILSMHPKHKKKSKSSTKKNGKDDGSTAAGTEDKDKQRRMFPGLAKPDQEWEPSPMKKDDIMKEVDDLMSQLEGASKKRPADTDRFAAKRPRNDSRSRSRSPPSGKVTRRRSPSPPRGRGYNRDGRGGRGRAPLDDRPVLFKIYDGRVSGLKEFGAFVTLEGVAGRVEGWLLYCYFTL